MPPGMAGSVRVLFRIEYPAMTFNDFPCRVSIAPDPLREYGVADLAALQLFLKPEQTSMRYAAVT